MKNYFHKSGAIGFLKNDGSFDLGDACQRTNSYIILIWAYNMLGLNRSQYPSTFRAHGAAHSLFNDGKPVRGPGPEWWYNPKNFSRDQVVSLLIKQGIYGRQGLTESYQQHLKRGLLCMANTRNNHQYPTQALQDDAKARGIVTEAWDGYKWKFPDPTGPSIWALYIRGFEKDWPRLLNALDLELLANAHIINASDEHDVSNHLNQVIYAHFRMPTKNSRKCLDLIDLGDFEARLARYYTGGDSVTWVTLYMDVLREIKK